MIYVFRLFKFNSLRASEQMVTDLIMIEHIAIGELQEEIPGWKGKVLSLQLENGLAWWGKMYVAYG